MTYESLPVRASHPYVIVLIGCNSRLLTFPNVLITGHHAFFTAQALQAIAETTVANLTAFEATGKAVHEMTAERHLCTARQNTRNLQGFA